MVPNTYCECIFLQIREVVLGTFKKEFLVPKSVDEKLTETIEELFAHRLIHKVGLAAIPEGIRSKYIVYTIDHGVYLDWTRNFKKERERSSKMTAIDDQSTEETIQSYVIDISKCVVPNNFI